MSIISICVLAVTAVILTTAIKPKNGEIALMLGVACSVIILIYVLTQVGAVTTVINQIIAASGVNSGYVIILLKVIGICLVTELAVNTCKDAGSQSLAGNVSLAGKIMITVTSLPAVFGYFKYCFVACESVRSKDVKKVFSVILIIVGLTLLSVFTVSAAEEGITYDLSGIYSSLSDEVKQILDNIGVDSADPQKISSLEFSSIVEEITALAGENAKSPLKGLLSVTTLLLLCSLLSAYKNSLSSDISSALNITCALCVTCAVIVPAVSVINMTSNIISVASNLMIAYIPIMVIIMTTAGQPVSSASYYAMVLAAGEGVGQISSRVIVPLLNMFLGFSVTSSVSTEINLSGFINIISKTVKWLLGFAMTIFTAVLTFNSS